MGFGQLLNRLTNVMLICILLVACSSHSSTDALAFSPQKRDSIERRLSGVHDNDSLMQLISDYRKSGDVLGQIVGLRRLGQLCREQSQFQWAIKHHQEGLDLAREVRDTDEIIKALNNLGTNHRRLGTLTDAAECHLQAYQLCLELGDSGLDKSVVALNGLGNVYLTMGNYQVADSLFRISLKGEQDLGNVRGQAINMANLGSIKEAQGQTDSAWTYYRESLRLNELCQCRLGLSLCHNHFGRLYEREGNLDMALQEYQTAFDILTGSPDEWHRLESGLNIVRLLINKGELDEAGQWLERGEKAVQRTGSLEHQASIQHLYYEYFKKRGEAWKALDHYIVGEELRDSLIGLKKVLHIQNARLQTERERRMAEVKLAEEKLQLERDTRDVMRLVFALLFLLAVAVACGLWYVLHVRTVKQRLLRKTVMAREQFFTNVTHEFRTPLTVILGLGHQLQDDSIEDLSKVRSAAKMIVRQGDALLELINQLLEVSKVRSALGEANWRRGNLVSFVAMVIDNCQPLAEAKRVELTYNHSLTAIYMDFVPDYIEKIVANLVGNAIKFTPSYGKVCVTLEQTAGNRVKLQVYDTGCGIAPEALPQIFDAFYQEHPHTGNLGTGIGLSLVQMLTQAMHGQVTAESILGKGSTFTVVLPKKGPQQARPLEEMSTTGLMIDAAGGALAEAAEPLPLPQAAVTAKTADTILIVEDHQDIARYIGMHLTRYNLIYARSGAEALEKATETMPHLVVTDLMMPGEVDGLELCRRLRGSELLNHIPIIVITAKTSDEARVSCFRAGADAYLVKPFNADELIVRVEKLLERQQLMRTKFVAPLDDEQSDKPLSVQDRQFMNKLIDSIYLLMKQGDADVESLAERMAMTKPQLNRRLMAITGQNTSSYMMRVRLSRAKRLLKADVLMPIGDVAQRCGFDDVTYFSRIFKQTFDMTPSQYRKQS